MALLWRTLTPARVSQSKTGLGVAVRKALPTPIKSQLKERATRVVPPRPVLATPVRKAIPAAAAAKRAAQPANAAKVSRLWLRTNASTDQVDAGGADPAAACDQGRGAARDPHRAEGARLRAAAPIVCFMCSHRS